MEDGGAILDLVYRNRDIPSANPENPTVEQTGSGSDDPLQGYDHSKISKMTAGHHLGFAPTGSSAMTFYPLTPKTLN